MNRYRKTSSAAMSGERRTAKGIMERTVNRKEERRENSRQWKINEGVVGRQRWLIAFYANGLLLHSHLSSRESRDFSRIRTEIKKMFFVGVGTMFACFEAKPKMDRRKKRKKERNHSHNMNEYCGGWFIRIRTEENGIKLCACWGDFPMATETNHSSYGMQSLAASDD